MCGEDDFRGVGLFPRLSGRRRTAVIAPVRFWHVPRPPLPSPQENGDSNSSQMTTLLQALCAVRVMLAHHNVLGEWDPRRGDPLRFPIHSNETNDGRPGSHLAWMCAVASPWRLNRLLSPGSVLHAAGRGTLSEGGDSSVSGSAGPASSLEDKARGPGAWAAPAAFAPLRTPAFALAARCLACSVAAIGLRCHPREGSPLAVCSECEAPRWLYSPRFGGLPTSEVTSQAAGAVSVLSAAGPPVSGTVPAHSRGSVGLCRRLDGSLGSEMEPGRGQVSMGLMWGEGEDGCWTRGPCPSVASSLSGTGRTGAFSFLPGERGSEGVRVQMGSAG